jgi:membrane protein implicated in regulation of membrane protease activity
LIIGREGIVEERLSPSGYIRVHGELWRAEIIEGNHPVEKGEIVQIKGIRGLVLFVIPKKLKSNCI